MNLRVGPNGTNPSLRPSSLVSSSGTTPRDTTLRQGPTDSLVRSTSSNALRNTTNPAMPALTEGASTESLYGTDDYQPVGSVPVIRPRTASELQPFSVFVPSSREMSMAELRKVLVAEAYRRNGFTMPNVDGVDLGKADPIGAASTFKLQEITLPNGTKQKGYLVDVSPETQQGYFQRASGMFPGAVFDDSIYATIEDRARKGENITEEELVKWGVDDAGLRNVYLNMANLAGASVRLANGEQNPELEKYTKDIAASLREMTSRSPIAAQMEYVVGRYERQAGMNVGNAVTPRSVLGTVDAMADYSATLGDASSFEQQIREHLASRGITEQKSVDAVVRTATTFAEMRNAFGKPDFAAKRAAFEQALASPDFQKVASKEEIALYKNAAARVTGRQQVYETTPKPELYKKAEQQLAELERIAAYVKQKHGVTNAGTYTKASDLAAKGAKKLRDALALPDTDPNKKERVRVASEWAQSEVLSFFANKGDAVKFLDETAEYTYSGLQRMGDIAEVIPGPIGKGAALAFKNTEIALRYGRGDIDGYEAMARSLGSAIDVVAADALRGQGGLPSQAIKAFSTKVITSLGPNVYAIYSNPKLNDAQRAEAYRRAVATALVEGFKDSMFGIAKGANGAFSPEAAQKFRDTAIAIADKMGVSQYVKNPLDEALNLPKRNDVP